MSEKIRVEKNDEGGLRAPSGLSPFGKIWWWFHLAILVKLARLRFIAVLAVIGLVIANWDTLRAHYEKWTRPVLSQETAVKSDSEFWCPMHPTIVRDHADKCPICAMPLSKRKKGDVRQEEALPPGVVSRVQLTPYKVAVAGIETAAIGYQPLFKDITTVGFVEFDERKRARITARAAGKSRIDKLYVNVTGQAVQKGEPLADLYSPEIYTVISELLSARKFTNAEGERMARQKLHLWGIDEEQIDRIAKDGKPITHVTIRSPMTGHVIKKYQVEGEYVEEGARLYDVADLSTVWIDAQVYEDGLAFLKEGLAVTATVKAFPNRELKGELAFLHPHLDANSRTLRVRFDVDNPRHELRPGTYATVRLQVPVTQLDLLAADADALSKHEYQEGRVLAVPERAVIDTGSHKFVYRETQPDTFEGVEAELGPRCGGYYPVVRGLRDGDRVATTGSFLIDAETRLTAGTVSTYFGASGGPRHDHPGATMTARPSMARDEDAKVQAALAKLSAADRRLVEDQRFCAVLSGNRLGEMGVPMAFEIKGTKVFLCCAGCKDEARQQADKTLDQVKKLKRKKAPKN